MKSLEIQKLGLLDEILKYLADKKSDMVYLSDIISNVGYDKLDNVIFTHLPKFKLQTDQLDFFFLKAMKHLMDEKMVDATIGQPNPYYTITFKGLLNVYSGGFLKPAKVKKEEYDYKKILWHIAIITFFVNTIFQVLNFAFKDILSTNASKYVEQVYVVHNGTTSILKRKKVSTHSGIKNQPPKSEVESK